MRHITNLATKLSLNTKAREIENKILDSGVFIQLQTLTY